MSPVDSRLALLAAEVRRDWQQVARHLDIATATDLDAGLAARALVALSLDRTEPPGLSISCEGGRT